LIEHKKRVLFVDDDPSFLRNLERMLCDQRPDWEMSFALSAEEALRVAAREDIDAVVVDVLMPGTDGFDLLSAWREGERTKDVPVVILTASDDRALKRRALDLGAADLLNKPFNREDLIARIRSVLRLKSYEDELRNQKDTLELKVKEQTAHLEQSRREIIWRLAKAGEYRDDETGNHVVRVACYCRAVAEGLGADHEFVDALFLTSPLHDIGKIGIPDRILLKRGRLTPKERRIMERHCAIGNDILTDAPKGMRVCVDWWRTGSRPGRLASGDWILGMASTIVMAHHERWDGRGYPGGLGGEEIPLEARIVGVADVYDALSSERPYKPAYPEQHVLAIMRGENGRHFDPAIFAVFENVLGDMRAIRAQFPDATAAA
jgi:putative two-component system response regulator